MEKIFNKKSIVCLITFLLFLVLLTPSICSFSLEEIKDYQYLDIDVILDSASYINTRPEAPIINGPHNGKVGISYTWTFMSTDPDEDNVTYYVDWGDVCGGAEYYGPYFSGEEVEISHTYTAINTYTINSMAIDEFGAESNMTYFDVSIPRAKTFFINTIFNLFYNLFRMIFNKYIY